MSAHKRDDPISRWLVQLNARVGWQKACVAMATKNARILRAVVTREQGFDPQHVSVKPEANLALSKRAAQPETQPIGHRSRTRHQRLCRTADTGLHRRHSAGAIQVEPW